MKKYLITGLLIWIPLVITLWVLKLVVDVLDQTLLLLPPEFRTENWLGLHVPGMEPGFFSGFGTRLLAGLSDGVVGALIGIVSYVDALRVLAG